MIAISVLGLYLWSYLSGNPNASSPFVINTVSASIASFTAILCIISYFWVPKKPMLLSLLIYLLTLSIAAVLILKTDGIESPFIAIWALISLFSYIFGLIGLTPVFLAVCAFTASQYIVIGNLSTESIVIIASGGLLPLFASLIIWRKKPNNKIKPEQAPKSKKPKDELGEMAAKSEIIVNAIGDGVIAIDSLGIIKLINPAAQDIIGWSYHDAVSLSYKYVLKLIDKNEKPLEPSNDPIAQVLNLNQQIRTNDLGTETKNNKKILISLVISPIGEVGSGVIIVFHDITKEKAEEREQTEFISTASHEMRTPVASIEGYIGLAMNPQTAQIDIRAREYLNKAHQSTQRLGRLFQDLLDISKADDGRLPNNPKPVNIISFTNSIVEDFRQKAKEKGLGLVFKPIPNDDGIRHIIPDYSVNLDNSHIYEILNNLIENAIKYTQKGHIIVDVTGNDDHVVISVQDSGIGISAEDMPHLFQKFYRVDNKDTREIGGTGLGLYLSRRLTESLDGRIWAESTPGVGSKFFVKLPRVEQIKTVTNDQGILTTQRSARQAIAPAQQTAQPQTVYSQTKPQPQQQIAPQPQPQTPVQPKQSMDVVRPNENIPRTQSLTPEQVAAYVAQQHALASQQPKPASAPVQAPVAHQEARR